MRRIPFLVLLAVSLMVGAVHADSPEADAARAFFAKYVALGEAYNEKVADLYSDGAVIRTSRRYPHGRERALELSGSQWKVLVVKAMPLDKTLTDRPPLSCTAPDFPIARHPHRVLLQNNSGHLEGGHFSYRTPRDNNRTPLKHRLPRMSLDAASNMVASVSPHVRKRST